MNDLTKRQRYILRHIIESYIDTATPISSNHIVQNYDLDVSSATVRNEMVDLERRGYIHQPHTSAGRIPTDKGYRYYVDHLMRPTRVEESADELIHGKMMAAEGDVKRILEEASRILGKISEELGVVLTPWISWGIFDHLELISLSCNKVLIVIHVQLRMVKTMILETQSELNQNELERTESILNERLHGLTLEEIKCTIGERVKDTPDRHLPLMQRVLEAAFNLFDFSEPLDIHTCGTQNMITQPEFSDVRMLESMFDLIDDRKGLIHLFHHNLQSTEVTIGVENQDERLQAFTIIKTTYRRGRDVGTLGVIGPKRMNYNRIFSLVDNIANTMTEYLS